MSDTSTGIFVQAPGTAKSIVAGAAGGVLGRMAAERGGANGPLAVRQIGFLAVGADEVTLAKAKRKVLLGGFTATDEVIATVPRASVTGATFEKGKIVGGLQVSFADGSSWTFEVPRGGNKTADQAIAALNQGA